MKQKIRIDCAGGCGKFQLTSKADRLKDFDAVGCGKCEGWIALDRQPVPEGMIKVCSFQAVAGFQGFKIRKATEEEQASIARARRIRDAAVEAIASRDSEIFRAVGDLPAGLPNLYLTFYADDGVATFATDNAEHLHSWWSVQCAKLLNPARSGYSIGMTKREFTPLKIRRPDCQSRESRVAASVTAERLRNSPPV